jgi:hypothetical protein
MKFKKQYLGMAVLFAIVALSTFFYERTLNANPLNTENLEMSSYEGHPDQLKFQELLANDLYMSKVKPILDNRCVACHSCYVAPCQLQMGSYDGVERGAKKDFYYDLVRLEDAPPSRLFIDAKNTNEWRHKGFYPVISKEGKPQDRLDDSILFSLIDLKQQRSSQYQTAAEPRSDYQVENSRTCPIPNQRAVSKIFSGNILETTISEYMNSKPWAGMPFGLPALSSEEHQTLKDWIAQGSPGPSKDLKYLLTHPSAQAQGIIFTVEDFLNRSEFKHQLAARYIYEHVFLAHLYFAPSDLVTEAPAEYYRLVRSKTRDGEIDEIATLRPYDDPKVSKFYYRFRRMTDTIVQKSHITYRIGLDRLARWNELFIDSDWGLKPEEMTLPDYDLPETANPFVSFKKIPSKIRYSFLLDDNYYHIMNFILGPVCRGNSALNVINDHFWVFFMDPSKDPMIQKDSQTGRDFIDKYGHLLVPPAANGAIPNLKKYVVTENKAILEYRRLKSELYVDKYPQGLNLDFIWDGSYNSNVFRVGQKNDGTILTIYRHFDSASVNKGALGEIPRTIWVVDYAILEDIYYNLVAGFSAYGTTIHQASTRFHMDWSRINGEDLFLSFLPPESRLKVREGWNLSPIEISKLISKVPVLNKISEKIHNKVSEPYVDDVIHDAPYHLNRDRKTQIAFKNSEPMDQKNELVHKFFSKLTPMARGFVDAIDSQKEELNKKDYSVRLAEVGEKIEKVRLEFRKREIPKGENIDQGLFDFIWGHDIAKPIYLTETEKAKASLSLIGGVKWPWLHTLPDLSYIRLRKADGTYLVYSMVLNREHFNVDFVFNEDRRLDIKNNSLNFIPGFVGSFPNYIFDFEISRLPDFVDQILRMQSSSSSIDANLQQEILFKGFGLSRFSPHFWEVYDSLNEAYRQYNPVEAGLIDLNRYLSR